MYSCDGKADYSIINYLLYELFIIYNLLLLRLIITVVLLDIFELFLSHSIVQLSHLKAGIFKHKSNKM